MQLHAGRWSITKPSLKQQAAKADLEQQVKAMAAQHAAEVKHLTAELARTETMASNRAEHFQGEIQRLNADHAVERTQVQQVRCIGHLRSAYQRMPLSC